jgi:nucleoid-associated protein YgaU
VRLDRSSVRFVVFAVGMALALSVLTACGGSAAAPTLTAVAPAASSASPAPSPARPALASPVASPSPGLAGATPTAAATEATAGGGESYEVQSGDTLATIAQQFYGDPTQWRRIYDANKDAIGADPDKLKLGMKLTIPPKQS